MSAFLFGRTSDLSHAETLLSVNLILPEGQEERALTVKGRIFPVMVS